MITPGELHPGMMISIIDSAPVFTEEDANWVDRDERNMTYVYLSMAGSTSPSQQPAGFGKVVLIKAVNLPLVIVQDIITKKHALHDCRKFVFREVDAAFVTLYVDAFTPQPLTIKSL